MRVLYSLIASRTTRLLGMPSRSAVLPSLATVFSSSVKVTFTDAMLYHTTIYMAQSTADDARLVRRRHSQSTARRHRDRAGGGRHIALYFFANAQPRNVEADR